MARVDGNMRSSGGWRTIPTSACLAAPGNPGAAALARCLPVTPAIRRPSCGWLRHRIDLTVVGPEGPLDRGIVGPVFRPRAGRWSGHSRACAALESRRRSPSISCRAPASRRRAAPFARPDPALDRCRATSSAFPSSSRPTVWPQARALSSPPIAAKPSGRPRGDGRAPVRRRGHTSSSRSVWSDPKSRSSCSPMARRDADRHGARSQAARRRRPWAEHGRHGRVRASPL